MKRKKKIRIGNYSFKLRFQEMKNKKEMTVSLVHHTWHVQKLLLSCASFLFHHTLKYVYSLSSKAYCNTQSSVASSLLIQCDRNQKTDEIGFDVLSRAVQIHFASALNDLVALVMNHMYL